MKSPLITVLLLLNLSLLSQTIENEKIFEWNNDIWFQDLIPTQDSGYLLLGNYFVMKLSSNCDSLWYKKTFLKPKSVIQANNSDFLIVGDYQGFGSFLRISKNGDSLTSFNPNSYFFTSTFYKIVELSSGDLVIAEVYRWAESPWLTQLICYSSSYEYKWSADMYISIPCDMILSSGNIITGGVAPDMDDVAWLSKVDTSGKK